MKLLIINGPNLNLLGMREPEIYGDQSFEDYFRKLKSEFSGTRLAYFQSNHEGELIDKLHNEGFDVEGIILNAGGLTHTSVALRDAIAGIKAPVIEVHISNVYAREPFRHKSLLAEVCEGIIAGLGLSGYKLAIQYFLESR